MEEKEVKLKVVPKYNFIYELGMPTGKKTKKTLLLIIIFSIVLLGINMLMKKMGEFIPADISQNILAYTNKILPIILLVLFIKMMIHIILQIIQYRCVSYNFYDDYLEYKDTFLNQQTKIFRYNNIREVEVRRSIWERINGFGIIIMYTNAEKKTGNGLVIYGIKNTQEVHRKIEELVSSKTVENVVEPSKDKVKR